MADEQKQQSKETVSRNVPVQTLDPKFLAGRAMLKQGLAKEGGIEIFSNMVEEAELKYGTSSIEIAPCYYEYGNSLLRAAIREAAALEERDSKEKEEDAKMPATDSHEKDRNKGEATENKTKSAENEAGEEGDDDLNKKKKEEIIREDLSLALEMMENAYSIYEDYIKKPEEESSSSDSKTDDGGKQEPPPPYFQWVTDEIPRVLLGIGDALAAANRHADAIDIYSRGLNARKVQLKQFNNGETSLSVEQLRAHRLICEATVLMAEQLLATYNDSEDDVVTTETKELIVKADERMEYIQEYYQQARAALHETCLYMAKCAGAKIDGVDDEKEDVCFTATLVMGVGEAIEAIREKTEEEDQDVKTSTEPVKKKAKS